MSPTYPSRTAQLSVGQLNEHLCQLMPTVLDAGFSVTAITAITADTVAPCVECTLRYDTNNIRPGNTLSGPSMMMLADAAMYALILAVDPSQALAVTQNLNIQFLHRPKPQDLVAKTRCLKYGKRSVVLQVDIYSGELLVANVTGAYALAGITNTTY